jgi:small subunit ribosomal protein S6
MQDPSWSTDFRRRPRRLPSRKKENMAFYEHVVIARQDISPQQAEALNEQLKTLLEENGGHIAKIEYWGLRNLTYRIKKNRKGHYSLLAIDAPAAAVKEMERQLLINEDVLRFMTIRVEELDLELSPVLARRDRERGDRTERRRAPARRLRAGRVREKRDHDRYHCSRSRRSGTPPLAAPAARSSVAARFARSRAPTRRRSTTRT